MLDDFDDPTDKLVPLDQCIDENDAYVDESGEIEALPWADRPTISPAEISDRRKRALSMLIMRQFYTICLSAGLR